ncbi:NADPH-dependent ferric siderophore reductase [Kribbella sp. VKM Ac-2527]|uniref:NADPH-dependent ferric siderophore reductase n=1 Tax=Kribbella caucasensis TaxID=2512215 RepID=A0A4R6KRZ8_9ACTN|nr:siderophore-interacting protein [Kribbella sp. VKM Ac-2527]TDO54974.1 NADPH-dependent ferric siderophore reductase [Kribbella sp. VKM Ac-2527]
MSTPAPRNRRAKLAVVRRTERITPHMIRVVLSCDEFTDNGTTDHYVKLLFPKAGVEYPEPLDMGIVRETFPADQWPTMRTYTVRTWDEAAAELTIDFVHHGDEGVAGPWAANAQPGDKLWFNGPGGGYAPDPAADWHLLVGDESALPAIGAAIEQLPAGARAKVYVEVEDESEEQKFGGSEEIELTWFHRAGVTGERGDQLVEAVESLEFPAGEVQAFVHGEAGFVFRIRRNLFKDRGLSRVQVSLSGYWRLGKNEDGWQAEKADTVRKEREEAATA